MLLVMTFKLKFFSSNSILTYAFVNETVWKILLTELFKAVKKTLVGNILKDGVISICLKTQISPQLD